MVWRGGANARCDDDAEGVLKVREHGGRLVAARDGRADFALVVGGVGAKHDEVGHVF